jgi:hypothetical protein
MDTITLTTRISCSAGHSWSPGAVPVLVGNPNDSIILLEGFTAPVTIDLRLDAFDKCPTCGAAATAIHFTAAPGKQLTMPYTPGAGRYQRSEEEKSRGIAKQAHVRHLNTPQE